MATPVAARTDSRRLWAGLLLYGLLIYFCLPAAVVPLDDDFGYLRSVVETLQHHRPWTNDWLEPWAASLSSLSALAYGVTGNFYGATYGLLAVFAAASFGFGVLLVRARGAELSAAMLLTALGLTFPTVFWKTIQYTSMALYLPCLLGALWAALRRRWLIYFVAWGLACAARQSAIAWIMLPLGVAFQSAGRERTLPRTREFWSPVIVALGGALLFLALQAGMNQTHAQAVLTDHTLERATAQGAWHSGLVGLGVFFVAMGIGLLVERLARGGTIDVQGWRPPAVLAVLAAGAVGLAAIDLRALVLWEHVAMAGPAGLWYLKLLVLAGGAGWMLRGSVVRREFALCAAAALALVCLRGPVWDYYFIDLAALGFFGGTLRCAEQAGSAMASAGVRRLTRTALVALAVVNALLVLDFKASLDRAAALCFASEQALRDGRLQPEELYFMPFGFTAWHLYPYYIQHEGRTSAQIDGFNALYLRPDAMQVGQGYSRMLHLLPRFRHVPPSDRHNLVAEAHTGFLWFFRAGYYILRFKTAAESPAPMRLQADFRPEPFPLSEAEWKQLIAGSLTVPAAPARQP